MPRVVARDGDRAGDRCRLRAPADAALSPRRWRARRCRCRCRARASVRAGGGARANRGFALAASCPYECVEREQAAARGAVMAGAEGECRLDLNADLVRPHAGAMMRPVHDETAGLDRREAFEALAHPIRRRQRLEHQRIGRRRAGGGRDQSPHRRFVGSIGGNAARATSARPVARRRKRRPLPHRSSRPAASPICRAVVPSVDSRATTVAAGRGEG